EYSTAGTASGTIGSGTQGQFAFYNAAGQDLTATSSIFADTGSRIGVATTSNALGAQFAVGGNIFVGNGTTATSTFNNNVDIIGMLHIGTSSILLNGNGTSTFSNGIQTNALSISSTGATSTSNVGFNISGGCYAINNTCITGGGGSGGTFSFTPGLTFGSQVN